MTYDSFTTLDPLDDIPVLDRQVDLKKDIISYRQREFLPVPFSLCIGPQRSGTSWLDTYLRARGDICLPSKV